jgi:hypothetical protein
MRSVFNPGVSALQIHLEHCNTKQTEPDPAMSDVVDEVSKALEERSPAQLMLIIRM